MMFEDITAAHIRAWGEPDFGDDHLICGFAGFSASGRMACLFCAYPIEDRWWVGFSRNEHCTRSVHKQVLKALNALASVELNGVQQVTEVWARCDDSQPRAREWMDRLGFIEMPGGELMKRLERRNDPHGHNRRHAASASVR